MNSGKEHARLFPGVPELLFRPLVAAFYGQWISRVATNVSSRRGNRCFIRVAGSVSRDSYFSWCRPSADARRRLREIGVHSCASVVVKFLRLIQLSTGL